MKRRNNQGIFVPFLAILMFAIVALIVAVLGLGLLSRSKSALLNATNLASLAALEGLVNTPGSNYAIKTQSGLNRAVEILSANKIPGTNNPLSRISIHPIPPLDSGKLTYGTWFQRDPDGNGPLNPCASSYPCFSATTTATEINAAKLELKTSPSDPVNYELGKFLGVTGFDISRSAIAAIVPRCTAYLSDLSGSVATQTHTSFQISNRRVHAGISSGPLYTCNPTTPDLNSAIGPLYNCNPKLVIKTIPPDGAPASLGLPAFKEVNLNSEQCTGPFPLTNRTYASPREVPIWCNLAASRNDTMANLGPRHFQDDYDLENSTLSTSGPLGLIRVDKYYEPPLYEGFQPGSNFLLAFNAGLRLMQSTQSGSDVGLVIMFADSIRDRVPTTGLTNDLNYLVQLTNMNNGGRKIFDPVVGANIPDPSHPELHPNYVDRGWIPIAGSSNTNIIQALYTAALALNQNCPPLSSKSIVLASDGVVTCRANGDPLAPAICGPDFTIYKRAEEQLLSTDINATVPAINRLMRNWEISVTTLHDGTGVRPHIYNIQNPRLNCGIWQNGQGYNTENPECYLNYEDARKLGYVAINARTNSLMSIENFDDRGAVTSPETAYINFINGTPGWIFGRAAALMAQLAIDTGGIYCPLLEPLGTLGTYNDSYVDFYNDRGGAACDADLDPTKRDCDKTRYACSPCVLKSRFRRPCGPGTASPTCDPALSSGHALTAAPELISKGEQAARCTRQAVGANPFSLVSENR